MEMHDDTRPQPRQYLEQHVQHVGAGLHYVCRVDEEEIVLLQFLELTSRYVLNAYCEYLSNFEQINISTDILPLMV